MGPNPLKLCEELLRGASIPRGVRVCDLGSGTGITSALLAHEYGLDTYAVDLWSDPQENRAFFDFARHPPPTLFTLLRRTPHKGCRLSTTFLMQS